jgi:predicted nuclease of predicted toxin-antitoxin system
VERAKYRSKGRAMGMVMKILLDENVTVQLPLLHSLLQEKGYDVVAQRIIAPGVPDEDVIARATQLGRTIITFDTDFPIHMFKYSRTVPFGVILIQESEDKVRPDDALMTRKLASAIDTIRDRESQRSI